MGMRASVEQVAVSSGNVTVHEGILVFFFIFKGSILREILEEGSK